jgi:autotransporter-associated beta strand protein
MLMEKMMGDSVRARTGLFLKNAVRVRRNSAMATAVAAAALCVAAPITRGQNTPVALAGWNEDLIGDSANLSSSVSSNLGTLLSATNDQVLYAQGLSTAGYGSGTINSIANNSSGVPTQTQFQLQSFTANNALLIGAGGASQTSATLTLANPSAYSSLTFLLASFDSSDSTSNNYFGYTFNYDTSSGGGTGGNSGASGAYYWDNPSQEYQTATTNLGTLNLSNGVTSPGVHLYEVVVNPIFLNSGKLIDSITFSSPYQTPVPFAIFAVSGTKATISYPITYNGTVSSKWNTTDANWYNTSAGSSSSPVDYNDNVAVTFDDNATGSTNISIASTGVKPLSVTFNNSSKTYNFSGGAIGGTTGMNLNGTGTVILNNTNTFTGSVKLNAGKLVIGPNGALTAAFQDVYIATGTTLELHGNSNLTGTILNDSGTVHVIGANVTGYFEFSTTGAVIIDPGSSFDCIGGGLSTPVTGGGTFILSNSINSLGTPVAGEMTIQTSSSLQCNVNVSGGSALTVGDAQAANNDITAGLVGTTPLLLTLSGTGNLANKTSTANGALLGADYSSDVWAGNVNVSGSTCISGGNGGTLTISGVIRGSSAAAVGFSSDQSSVTILAAVNTYTGETQVIAPANGSGTLQLGTANAINPASGLNLAGAGYNTFDLNGFNVSVAYLTWNPSSSSSLITNSSGTPATLTVIQKAGTNSYGGQISDGGGPLSLVFSGTGNQTLTANNSYSGGTIINSGTVTASSISALGSGVITINGGGLILSNTSAGTVFSLLQSGYNNGAWNGSAGINSTAAADDTSNLHALGMLQPTTATTFEGQPLGTGDVAVKFTYYGDANLDGKVDGSDYSVIDNAYLADQTNPAEYTGWSNGDFNYDGVIDGSDYTLIDNAFNMQGATISSEVASETAQLAGVTAANSSVPEPISPGLLAIGSMTLLCRRRRGNRLSLQAILPAPDLLPANR